MIKYNINETQQIYSVILIPQNYSFGVGRLSFPIKAP